ncbi:MAG: glutamyl-tRNA reductase [Moraxella sp.]|nr:glutamyl-tRNA reductase [Moraxella sp.]
MKIIVIGVNHKTAPVAMRERLSFGDDMTHAIGTLNTLPNCCGAVIVSTCNRSEIYVGFDCDDDDDEHPISPQADMVSHWLADFKGIDFDELSPYLYIYENARALNHWIRVASGLDSMILGEPQIFGQIRNAVSLSKELGGISGQFDWLTQQVFASARTVRRDTKVGQQAVTLGFATAKLVTQIFDDPQKLTLLIVAAGEMNRLVAHNVATLGMKHIIIANRSPERANTLKDELTDMAKASSHAVQIDCIGLDKLADALSKADVVSSCSGSMQTLISLPMIKSAQKARRYRPMLLVDLAVPRDIEPSIAHLDEVYLYSVDDLQHVIKGNLEERKQAAVEAELLASQLTSNIETQIQLLSARKMIADYRQAGLQHKNRLLAIAKHRLAQGERADVVLDMFAHALTQTLTHPPSRLIRHVATTSDPAVLDMVVNGLDAYRPPKPR